MADADCSIIRNPFFFVKAVDSGQNGDLYWNHDPFRYCGEYFDKETGTYYLRVRNYDPALGRFLSEDPHWNPSNMIYGDHPLKWNETAEDPLGLNRYTYFVDTNAVLQSGNLYVYCGNNPVAYKDSDGEAFETIWDAVSLAVSIGEVAANPYDPWAWVALAGDAADALIPFVGGIGETTRALKAASQASDAIDIASGAKKGWKIGDDITNLTKSGNDPKWSTLKSRYWKNKAYYFKNDPLYDLEDIKRMEKGLAPQIVEDGKLRSMELHHILGRNGDAYYLFFEITPKGHSQIDPYRYVK